MNTWKRATEPEQEPSKSPQLRRGRHPCSSMAQLPNYKITKSPVSAITSELARNCKRCASELPAGALDCPKCHTLVHDEQLERTAARARALEANGALWDAHEQWQSALPLLPAESGQAQWIR